MPAASRILTWHMLAGLLLGGVLAPFTWEWADDYVSQLRIKSEQGTPVIRSVGEIVERGDGWVTIIVRGEKLRDCKRPAIQAYTVDASRVLTAAKVVRYEDGTSELASRPLGPFVSGPWKVWPVSGTNTKVRLDFLYDCYGVEVRNVLAEIEL